MSQICTHAFFINFEKQLSADARLLFFMFPCYVFYPFFIQVGERFDCLSFTFEMPFKDTIDDPNHLTGWSPERSIRLGASVLDAIKAVMPDLR